MNELILSKLEVANLNANFASVGSVPRAILGDYTGLAVSTPTVASLANTLVVNQVNLQTYTGAAALASALPPATAGAVVVLVITEDPAGGVAAMTINCAGTDAFRTGSCIPTTSSNKMAYDVSTAGETAIVFTPTNDTVNFLSYDSALVFTCLDAGLWNVNVNAKADIGVTAGAATGTLLFAA